ncbi:unnamed protein product [Amoebophrya sp. A120]|nr:unnamed protein product [Amoebophrya sp. A120]|eukprot:GSA120T00010389001.1
MQAQGENEASAAPLADGSVRTEETAEQLQQPPEQAEQSRAVAGLSTPDSPLGGAPGTPPAVVQDENVHRPPLQESPSPVSGQVGNSGDQEQQPPPLGTVVDANTAATSAANSAAAGDATAESAPGATADTTAGAATDAVTAAGVGTAAQQALQQAQQPGQEQLGQQQQAQQQQAEQPAQQGSQQQNAQQAEQQIQQPGAEQRQEAPTAVVGTAGVGEAAQQLQQPIIPQSPSVALQAEQIIPGPALPSTPPSLSVAAPGTPPLGLPQFPAQESHPVGEQQQLLPSGVSGGYALNTAASATVPSPGDAQDGNAHCPPPPESPSPVSEQVGDHSGVQEQNEAAAVHTDHTEAPANTGHTSAAAGPLAFATGKTAALTFPALSAAALYHQGDTGAVESPPLPESRTFLATHAATAATAAGAADTPEPHAGAPTNSAAPSSPLAPVQTRAADVGEIEVDAGDGGQHSPTGGTTDASTILGWLGSVLPTNLEGSIPMPRDATHEERQELWGEAATQPELAPTEEITALDGGKPSPANVASGPEQDDQSGGTTGILAHSAGAPEVEASLSASSTDAAAGVPALAAGSGQSNPTDEPAVPPTGGEEEVGRDSGSAGQENPEGEVFRIEPAAVVVHPNGAGDEIGVVASIPTTPRSEGLLTEEGDAPHLTLQGRSGQDHDPTGGQDPEQQDATESPSARLEDGLIDLPEEAPRGDASGSGLSMTPADVSPPSVHGTDGAAIDGTAGVDAVPPASEAVEEPVLAEPHDVTSLISESPAAAPAGVSVTHEDENGNEQRASSTSSEPPVSAAASAEEDQHPAAGENVEMADPGAPEEASVPAITGDEAAVRTVGDAAPTALGPQDQEVHVATDSSRENETPITLGRLRREQADQVEQEHEAGSIAAEGEAEVAGSSSGAGGGESSATVKADGGPSGGGVLTVPSGVPIESRVLERDEAISLAALTSRDAVNVDPASAPPAQPDGGCDAVATDAASSQLPDTNAGDEAMSGEESRVSAGPQQSAGTVGGSTVFAGPAPMRRCSRKSPGVHPYQLSLQITVNAPGAPPGEASAGSSSLPPGSSSSATTALPISPGAQPVAAAAPAAAAPGPASAPGGAGAGEIGAGATQIGARPQRPQPRPPSEEAKAFCKVWQEHTHPVFPLAQQLGEQWCLQAHRILGRDVLWAVLDRGMNWSQDGRKTTSRTVLRPMPKPARHLKATGGNLRLLQNHFLPVGEGKWQELREEVRPESEGRGMQEYEGRIGQVKNLVQAYRERHTTARNHEGRWTGTKLQVVIAHAGMLQRAGLSGQGRQDIERAFRLYAAGVDAAP